ncbi:MAG: histidine phosphatase family protein [Archangium sp.]|nr:histidine phosphatase family protein [Archangium sp.]
MKVFLIRHGDAEADAPEGLDDDSRALTARARHALPGHFAALASHFGAIDLIFTSPLVRAVQTSTLLSHALSYEGPLRAQKNLFPDGPVGAIEALLAQHAGKTVVLVGHQPSMGATAAHFLGYAAFPKPVAPGTVIGIERPDDAPTPAKLLCYAAPGQPILSTL